MDAGMDAHITKPVDIVELFAAINELCKTGT